MYGLLGVCVCSVLMQQWQATSVQLDRGDHVFTGSSPPVKRFDWILFHFSCILKREEKLSSVSEKRFFHWCTKDRQSSVLLFTSNGVKLKSIKWTNQWTPERQTVFWFPSVNYHRKKDHLVPAALRSCSVRSVFPKKQPCSNHSNAQLHAI